jgi:hypothetical protein
MYCSNSFAGAVHDLWGKGFSCVGEAAAERQHDLALHFPAHSQNSPSGDSEY